MNIFKSMLIGTSFAVASLGFNLESIALEVGETAPCVVLNQIQADGTDVEGCIMHTIDEAHKHTLLEFFSITCGACSENLPIVSALHDEFKDSLTVRLVSVDRNEAKVRSHVLEHRNLIQFPVALDLDRDAKRAYDIIATPTQYLLNRDNVVVYKNIGTLDDEQLAKLRSLLL